MSDYQVMDQQQPNFPVNQVPRNLVTVTQIVYFLHGLSIVLGVFPEPLLPLHSYSVGRPLLLSSLTTSKEVTCKVLTWPVTLLGRLERSGMRSGGLSLYGLSAFS